MAVLHQELTKLLQDKKITDDEVNSIREIIDQDGCLDLEDVKFLVELLSGADEVCPAFDELFFPVLKEVILKDGKVGYDEQFYLLKMLYSDGIIRESEKQFLRELQCEAVESSPEFNDLYNTAMNADSQDWDVGGVQRV